jgi:lysophospholipase-2
MLKKFSPKLKSLSISDRKSTKLNTIKMSTNTVSIPASGKQSATIIFLHGLGDTGHGWASTIAAIKPSYAKCICPTAQVMPVTLNGGFPMPSWFDLYSLDSSGPTDEEGIKKARNLVHQMISDEEKAGIPANRIVIGGFSQGGALALLSGLTYSKPIGGILAFSCWIPMYEQFANGVNNKDVPILQTHGDSDPIVPLRWGQLTSELLKKVMTNYEFKVYKGMQHSSCEEELSDAKTFFAKCLP